MIKTFGDYWHFSRKYNQFLRVASLSVPLASQETRISEETRAILAELNEQKERCHARIGELNLPSLAACESCSKGCCNNSSPYYFTPIDFWLSKYGSSSDAPDFGRVAPEPLHRYFHARVKSMSRRLVPQGSLDHPPEPGAEQPEKCRYLGEDGCHLPHEERPIKCVLYACPRLKESMDEATRAAYREAIGDLLDISLKAFNVMKAEAGLPPHYGLASIFLTP